MTMVIYGVNGYRVRVRITLSGLGLGLWGKIRVGF